jgi:methionyl-tRNA formyltransferase
MLKKLRIAITSGYGASKHACALLHEISLLPGVEVVLLLQVKTFSFQRLRQLIRMYGVKDAWEKFKNVFLRSSNNRFADEVGPINQYLKDREIRSSNTVSGCKELNIEFKKVKSLNDKNSLALIRQCDVDLIVYSGGGILRSDFIKSSKHGVLNAHSGPLPYFRGMNCLEWSLLHNVKPEVTVHLIDTGIDTGPILKRFPWEVSTGDSIPVLRGKSVVIEVKALLDVLSNFQHYEANKQTQQKSEGVQFYTMHPILKEVIGKRLQEGWVPTLSYDEFAKMN